MHDKVSFFGYGAPRAESCRIQRWRGRQCPAVQAKLDSTLELLAQLPQKYWDTGEHERERSDKETQPFKWLQERKNCCGGLGEIRVLVNMEHYRVFGVFGQNEREFVMLVPFRKALDNTYRKTCPCGQKRRKTVASNKGWRHEWPVP